MPGDDRDELEDPNEKVHHIVGLVHHHLGIVEMLDERVCVEITSVKLDFSILIFSVFLHFATDGL